MILSIKILQSDQQVERHEKILKLGTKTQKTNKINIYFAIEISRINKA